ncbi:hypothetical protein BDY21DRAFT_338838 [Lineolata rhizophorae]|uniref:Uncharacterized protein n=1 Tax=Lineolata rhizophorae TaxID=578093 RepID=A0A6A6P6M7_9PEZI|nr:hypothetical protein BDY21DRAFT_338838 [Lineolata rhizophorae]
MTCRWTCRSRTATWRWAAWTMTRLWVWVPVLVPVLPVLVLEGRRRGRPAARPNRVRRSGAARSRTTIRTTTSSTTRSWRGNSRRSWLRTASSCTADRC